MNISPSFLARVSTGSLWVGVELSDCGKVVAMDTAGQHRGDGAEEFRKGGCMRCGKLMGEAVFFRQ